MGRVYFAVRWAPPTVDDVGEPLRRSLFGDARPKRDTAVVGLCFFHRILHLGLVALSLLYFIF